MAIMSYTFVVFVLATISLVIANKGPFIKDQDDNFVNEVLEDCSFNGKMYKPGEAIYTEDKCIQCKCPITGGPTHCTGYFCPAAPCVNPVIPEGECCPACLDGKFTYTAE